MVIDSSMLHFLSQGPANDPVEKEATFVPEDFGQTGPFKALKVDSSQCIVANISDGSLSLKTFHETEPHPGTIFVISKM